MTRYAEMLRKDRNVRRLRYKAETGRITAKEMNALAAVAGRVAGKCIATMLDKDNPSGIYADDEIRAVVSAVMKENHAFVSEMAAMMINAQYRAERLGLVATTPFYSQEREEEIVQEIVRRSRGDEFFG